MYDVISEFLVIYLLKFHKSVNTLWGLCLCTACVMCVKLWSDRRCPFVTPCTIESSILSTTRSRVCWCLCVGKLTNFFRLKLSMKSLKVVVSGLFASIWMLKSPMYTHLLLVKFILSSILLANLLQKSITLVQGNCRLHKWQWRLVWFLNYISYIP